MANVFISPSSIGDAGTGSPQFIATVALPASTPLMLDIAGNPVPNDGTAAVIGLSPVGSVIPGQSFNIVGLNIAGVNTAAPYVAGTNYYLQTNGTISSTATVHYVGTAIDTKTLVVIPEVSAAVASAAAPPGLAITDGALATVSNKLLTYESVRNTAPSVPGTILVATGAAGAIDYRLKASGVHFALSLTAPPTADNVEFVKLPTLPGIATGYLAYGGVFNDSTGKIGGMLLSVGDGLRIVRETSFAGGSISAAGFVEYA